MRKIRVDKVWKLIIIQATLLILVCGCVLLTRGEYDKVAFLNENVSLSKGVYEVDVTYEGAEELKAIEFLIGEGDKTALKWNSIVLYPNEAGASTTIWVKRQIGSLCFQLVDSTGTCEVTSISINRRNSDVGIFTLLYVTICVMLDCFFVWKRKHSDEEAYSSRKSLFILSTVIVFSSIPLFTDYVITGADLAFHLSRIEGVAQGFLSGQFPVRIQPQWLYGKGYASSIFYSDLFLIFPALLKMVGLPFQDCYKTYIFVINAATIVTAYFCFKRLFQNKECGLLAACLYGMAPYRLYNVYARCAVGEYTAMLFLPVIILGFWEIYSKKREETNAGWLILTVGLSGIINCHILTCEMVAGAIVVLCVLKWKLTIRRDIFFELAKTVVATVVVNLWFLVPFFEYMITADLWVNHMSANTTIQQRGLYPAHLFLATLFSGEYSNFDEIGMVSGEPTTVGIVLFGGYLVFLCKRVCSKEREGKYTGLATTTAILSGILMVLSLNLFPWDYFQSMNGILAKLISSLQFPFRLLSLLTALLVVIAVILANCLHERRHRIVVGTLLITLQFCVASFMLNDFLFQRGFIRLYDANNLGTTSIMSGEYIPEEMTLADAIRFIDVNASEGVELVYYDKENLSVEMSVENLYSEERYVDLPMLSYPGYRARDIDTGELLKITDSENGLVRVIIPGSYSGGVAVKFVSPWYWRLAEMISLISVVLCVVWSTYKQRKRLEVRADDRN